MPQKKFTETLSLYRPDKVEIKELISSALVSEMTINREIRALSLTVLFRNIPERDFLEQIKDGIKAAYSLSAVELFPKYPKELFTTLCLKELTETVCENIPAAAPFLNGCDFDRQGNEIHIKLIGGGAYILEQLKCDLEYKKLLSDYFSITEIKILFDQDDSENCLNKLDKYAKNLLVTESSNGHQKTPLSSPPKKTENSKPAGRPRARRAPKPSVKEEDILLGSAFGDEIISMGQINSDFGRVAICGEIFSIETRETYSKKQLIISADITDKTGSIRIKRILETEKAKNLLKKLKVGTFLKVRGDMEYDKYYGDYTLKPLDMFLTERPSRRDTAKVKRVELHMHTNMSQMDAVSSPASLINRAIDWGHTALAITDHGVIQGFPEAVKAANGVKIIYGTEGYFVNDLADITVVTGNGDNPLNGEFICFDLETTGTDPTSEGITQIAACIVSNGEIKDTFETFTNPQKPISPYISQLTGITDDMVKNAPSQREGVEKFKEFCGGRILVAHNAAFDTGFISSVCAKYNISWEFTSIDTLEMSRILMPELRRHKLNIVAEALNLPKFRHHSAFDDAKTLALIFIDFIQKMSERDIKNVSEINVRLSDIRRENNEKGSGKASLPVRHIILLAKNRTGIINLYRLVSLSHIKYLNRRKQPIIPKHELEKYREGLIVGSACESGELFSAVVEGKSWHDLKKIARFYDYLEIQPLGNNDFLIRDGLKKSKEEVIKFSRKDLISFNKNIIKLGEELNIPVVATGDVHFLDSENSQYRAILMAAEGFKDADFQPPLYFRTTDEMLDEFSYLGRKKAYEVVVKNTNLIADMCEILKPFPDGLFPPELPGSADELRCLTWSRAKEMYGDPLPEIVEKAILQELDPIITHGYDVMYMFAHKLIARSMKHGYLVGSRGSVGSSVVAFFSGITEINALYPHYRCKNCKYSEFHPECDLGPDMEDKLCPVCGVKLEKDGFNIPFATFLGFNADKDPDIDLNFSSEYQAMAHRHTMELFGEDKVFKAGTISTIAQATAYGYVKKYNEARGRKVNKAEESRLALGCTGVKKTTGQHPGGLVVIPRNKEIYEFCPIQRPAGKTDTDIITTHIDYHSLESNLLKFDLLGKDDPTVLRYLEDNTGVRVEDIPLDDKSTLEIFRSNQPLGIREDEITGFNGALGIPEFGTSFVRGMLNDTQPETIADLIRISGLSHGEGVWLDNADMLLKEKGVQLKDCICCRDDIMNYLIKKGIEPKLAFTIMEVVRKKPKEPGMKKLKPEWEEIMRKAGIADWYIDSCNKITYLFPKAHAAAYVIMALRIAWFKVHHPLAYYGSFFSIKAVQLDANIMLADNSKIIEKIRQINELGNKATATEKELRRTLEITHEYLLRGFKFLPVNIYESEPVYFKICHEENALRLPFRAIPGLGDVAAPEIVAQRNIRPFASIEDLAYRCRKLSTTVIEDLKAHGALNGIPDSSQTVLFDL